MADDRLCREEGCGKKIHGHGLCMTHYGIERTRRAVPCSVAGCARGRYVRDLCVRHYVAKKKCEAPACHFSGCDRPSYSHGLCKVHRAQRLRGGPLRPFVKPYRMPKVCSFAGCGRTVHGHGLCRAHWGQRYHGNPLSPIRPRWHRGEPPRICSLPDCNEPYSGQGLCREHYWIMKYEENKLRKAEERQKREHDTLASALAIHPAILARLRARSFCAVGGF